MVYHRLTIFCSKHNMYTIVQKFEVSKICKCFCSRLLTKAAFNWPKNTVKMCNLTFTITVFNFKYILIIVIYSCDGKAEFPAATTAFIVMRSFRINSQK